ASSMEKCEATPSTIWPDSSPNQLQLFPARQPLDGPFTPERRTAAGSLFRVHQIDREARTGIARRPPPQVRAKPALEVVGGAGVERAVRTPEDVHAPGRGHPDSGFWRRSKPYAILSVRP